MRVGPRFLLGVLILFECVVIIGSQFAVTARPNKENHGCPTLLSYGRYNAPAARR